ncbi:polyprenyl synthetase family protein [Jiella marina]|uniref:polyprenyl synthetase family protein n=1 Tax=Jiella sp. LLJ827 TaxID=2917712 RepID=UPI002101BA8F|nr:polyprenyl synthetase family protein [Jiella sp. LLJ827]MCQ0986518.1 polyprenyl synthetase family protein [Jiella sp. LLJ827]
MTPDMIRSLSAQRAKIDRRLDALVPRAFAGQTALDEAIAASILAPGKRLRPMMTMMVTADLGGDPKVALDAGCAIEMVHASSLTLDDLPCMDDSALRRGRPAIHVSFGEDVAVLAAIASLSAAFETLARLPGANDGARAECVAILTQAVGVRGLVAGQFADLREGQHKRGLNEIAETNGLKTGSLFSAAVEIGAVVAGASDAVRAELRAFAAELGHAFQLLDDLLDGDDNAGLTGKDVNKDVGKSTIVSMIGQDSVVEEIARHVAEAHQRLNVSVGRESLMHACVDFIFGEALSWQKASDVLSQSGAHAK